MTTTDRLSQSPNIALVVLDTLRKDAFDDHFDWLPGRRFESAWSPSHWTVPAHGSLFTGKYASETGVHAKSTGFDYPDGSLPEYLSEVGYTTRAFSCNVNIAPQSDFDRGFDDFYGNWRVSSLGSDIFSWGAFANDTSRTGFPKYLKAMWACIRSDASTVPSLHRGAKIKLRDLDLNGALVDDGAREAKSWLQRTSFGDGEFLFTNLMEAHSPYLPPRGYRSVKRVDVDSLRSYFGEPQVNPDTARQAYDDCVRYLSDRYRDMYDELSTEFDYIITVSDHGELLGEHGAWDHLYGLYPELTHVPLVVDGPGLDGTSTQTVSLLDVHATVLDIAGVEAETRGRSLLDDPESSFWLTEYHGLTPQQVESLEEDGYDVGEVDTPLRGLAGPSGYYGYETPDDLIESGDLPTDDSLQEKIEALEEAITPRMGASHEPSEEVQSQLEALGYV